MARPRFGFLPCRFGHGSARHRGNTLSGSARPVLVRAWLGCGSVFFRAVSGWARPDTAEGVPFLPCAHQDFEISVKCIRNFENVLFYDCFVVWNKYFGKGSKRYISSCPKVVGLKIAPNPSPSAAPSTTCRAYYTATRRNGFEW